MARSRRITAAAVSTMAALAVGTGGMLAFQATAHATETGSDGLIATFNGNGMIEENADGTNLKVATRDVIEAQPPAWSSDGSELAWTSGGVQVAPADMSSATTLAGPLDYYAENPTWFDQNTSIVFDASSAGPGGVGTVWQLYSKTVTTGVRTPLFPADTGFNDMWPKATGDLIVFGRTTRGSTNVVQQLWVYDKSTATAHKVADGAAWGDVSPDGKTVLFASNAGDLFTVDLDGSNLTQITHTGRLYQHPVWSPSGTKVAFDDGTSTSILDVASGVETPLPNSGRNPAWQPLNADAPAPPLPTATTPSTQPSSQPSSQPTSQPSDSAPSTTPSTTPSTSPSSSPSTTPPPPAQPAVQRIAGDNRYDTGVKTSRQLWPDATDTSIPAGEHAQAVVLATGASFPDALAGGPLASAVGGPLLLTDPNSLPDETLQEIKRVLAPGRGLPVYILGQTGAVGEPVERALIANGYAIHRLGGRDRFETSRIIAGEFARHVPAQAGLAAVVATGKAFPDALSAGPLASLLEVPIILTNGSSLDPATAQFISGKPVLPVGGPAYAAVGATPVTNGQPCLNLAGADRYSTSADVANCIEQLRGIVGLSASPIIGVATGLNYPDALTGGALLGVLGEPLLLTDPNSLSPQAEGVLEHARQNLRLVALFGGTGALAPRVEQQVVAAIGGVDLKPLFTGGAVPAFTPPSAAQRSAMTATAARAAGAVVAQ